MEVLCPDAVAEIFNWLHAGEIKSFSSSSRWTWKMTRTGPVALVIGQKLTRWYQVLSIVADNLHGINMQPKTFQPGSIFQLSTDRDRQIKSYLLGCPDLDFDRIKRVAEQLTAYTCTYLAAQANELARHADYVVLVCPKSLLVIPKYFLAHRVGDVIVARGYGAQEDEFFEVTSKPDRMLVQSGHEEMLWFDKHAFETISKWDAFDQVLKNMIQSQKVPLDVKRFRSSWRLSPVYVGHPGIFIRKASDLYVGDDGSIRSWRTRPERARARFELQDWKMSIEFKRFWLDLIRPEIDQRLPILSAS